MRIILAFILLFWSQASAQLVQESDLEYVGAFRLPEAACGSITNCFSYAGQAIAYNPTNDSLFIIGHDHSKAVSEISIPTPSISTTFTSLPRAIVLQPFVDGLEGRIGQVDAGTIKIGGMLVEGDYLYITAYSYYDADGSQQLSHFRRPTNLSERGQVVGPVKVGAVGAGFVSGYMTHSHDGTALTGNCCLSIISRTSYGPAAFSFNPGDIGAINPVPANPLVYYSSTNHTLGDWNQQSDYFNGTTKITGVVFPVGTRSVLFLGRHGIGPWCYGPGTWDKALDGTMSPGGQLYCYDPVSSSTGNHAYPYVYQVWAYNADDFQKGNPWDVKPYAIWRPILPFRHSNAQLGGVAHDPATNRIYVFQSYASSNGQGVVYVFKVSVSGLPQPPFGLTVAAQ